MSHLRAVPDVRSACCVCGAPHPAYLYTLQSSPRALPCWECWSVGGAIEDLAFQIARFARRCRVDELRQTIWYIGSHDDEESRAGELALDELAAMAREGR